MAGLAPRKVRCQKGATLVEFALSWTIFFIITIVGVMDFGRSIWAYNLVSHAARAGVRYAMVHGSQSANPATAADIEAIARKQAFFLEQSNLTVTTTWEDAASKDAGTDVEVRVLYTFTPLLGVFQAGTFDLGSKSKKVITY